MMMVSRFATLRQAHQEVQSFPLTLTRHCFQHNTCQALGQVSFESRGCQPRCGSWMCRRSSTASHTTTRPRPPLADIEPRCEPTAAKAGPVGLTCDGSGRLDRSAFGEMLYSLTQGKASRPGRFSML